MLPDIQQALNDALLVVSSNTSYNLSPCVTLVENYLCYYYFPRCIMRNNKILPVCRDSCNLLFNNEECSSLLQNALSVVIDHNITLLPDNNSCAMTYRSFTDSDQPINVSEECLEIEGQKCKLKINYVLVIRF